MLTKLGPRVVVVGAGVVGACIAWRVAQAGGIVTLIERGNPGSGASGLTFAWVGGSYLDAVERPEYFALKVRGVAAVERMASVLGGAQWLHRSGVLVWSCRAGFAGTVATGLKALSEEGIRTQFVTRGRAAELEPQVQIPEGSLVVGYCPNDGYVDGVQMSWSAVEASSQHGAVVRTSTVVENIVEASGRVRGVRVAGGEVIPADTVVVAAGTETERIIADSGGFLPLVSSRDRGSDALGLLVTTRPNECHIRRVNVGDDLMFRPDSGSRLLLHSYDVDRVVLTGDPQGFLRRKGDEVVALLRRYVRTDEDLTVESSRVGVRPIPVDGLPACGWVGHMSGLYAVVTHSGMSLGPLLGEAVAAEVIEGQDVAFLQSFRPSRFKPGMFDAPSPA